jgi:hypothetical protein
VCCWIYRLPHRLGGETKKAIVASRMIESRAADVFRSFSKWSRPIVYIVLLDEDETHVRSCCEFQVSWRWETDTRGSESESGTSDTGGNDGLWRFDESSPSSSCSTSYSPTALMMIDPDDSDDDAETMGEEEEPSIVIPEIIASVPCVTSWRCVTCELMLVGEKVEPSRPDGKSQSYLSSVKLDTIQRTTKSLLGVTELLVDEQMHLYDRFDTPSVKGAYRPRDKGLQVLERVIQFDPLATKGRCVLFKDARGGQETERDTTAHHRGKANYVFTIQMNHLCRRYNA